MKRCVQVYDAVMSDVVLYAQVAFSQRVGRRAGGVRKGARALGSLAVQSLGPSFSLSALNANPATNFNNSSEQVIPAQSFETIHYLGIWRCLKFCPLVYSNRILVHIASTRLLANCMLPKASNQFGQAASPVSQAVKPPDS